MAFVNVATFNPIRNKNQSLELHTIYFRVIYVHVPPLWNDWDCRVTVIKHDYVSVHLEDSNINGLRPKAR